MPDGKDPDEFIRKHGKEAFDELIKNAQTLVDYRLNYVLARANRSTIDGKIRALHEILPVVVGIKNEVTRNEYLKQIASALVLDEVILSDEWEKFSRAAEQSTLMEKPPAVQRRKLSGDDDTVVRRAGEIILRISWQESEMLDYVMTIVPRELFTPLHREIIDWLESCAAQDKRVNRMSAARDLSEEANAELSRILINGADELREEIALFEDAVDTMKRVALKRQYNEFLAQAEKYISSDRAAYVNAVQQSLKIKNKIDKLKRN